MELKDNPQIRASNVARLRFSFFNEIYRLCVDHQIIYKHAVEGATAMGKIGESVGKQKMKEWVHGNLSAFVWDRTFNGDRHKTKAGTISGDKKLARRPKRSW